MKRQLLSGVLTTLFLAAPAAAQAPVEMSGTASKPTTIEEGWNVIAPRAGHVFTVLGVEGDWVSVPALKEVWRVNPDGEFGDRAVVRYTNGSLVVQWYNGVVGRYEPSMEVNYSWAERSIPWLIAMDAFVSSDDGGPLAISGFPEGARMWPERVIDDAAGNYIGRWDIDLDSGMLALRLQDGDVTVEAPAAEFFMTAEAAKVGRVLP